MLALLLNNNFFYMITILTPTYNRASQLKTLYNSLCKQTNYNFEWIIIDDGSTDGTNKIIDSFNNKNFPITYKLKSNGGKHTAMNYSHQFIKGECVIIVDSDDYLEENAIEIIINDWEQYKNNQDIAILSYVRKTKDGVNISQSSYGLYLIDDDINYRVNKNINGDRCEVVRSSIFTKYKMPEFKGEKFMGEGWLWTTIAKKYKTVYINKGIYICEYLEGGLTKSGRLFRMRNPLGMMENCRVYMDKPVCLRVRIKETLLYGVYMLCSSNSIFDTIKKSRHIWSVLMMFPFSIFLYIYWKYKYGYKK